MNLIPEVAGVRSMRAADEDFCPYPVGWCQRIRAKPRPRAVRDGSTVGSERSRIAQLNSHPRRALRHIPSSFEEGAVLFIPTARGVLVSAHFLSFAKLESGP